MIKFVLLQLVEEKWQDWTQQVVDGEFWAPGEDGWRTSVGVCDSTGLANDSV